MNKRTEVEACHKTDILYDFEKSVEFDEANKRCKVKLPFNGQYDFLPDNFNLAKNGPLAKAKAVKKVKT